MAQKPLIATPTTAAAAKAAAAKTTDPKAKLAAAKTTAQTPAVVVSLKRTPAQAPPTYSAAAPTPAAKPADAPLAEGALYTTGDGHVVIDIMNSDSGYDNKIYWSSDNWATRNYLGVDNNTASVDLGSFAKGTKIQLAIDNGQGGFFKTGAASGNADNYQHARVTSDAGGMTIGFEDLTGGGDQDFNDAIVRVRGLSSETGAAVTPKPQLPVPPEPAKNATPAPQKPLPKDNRSGLGDGTNPGQGGGRVNSPNTGTNNPNKSGNVLSSAQQAADARRAIIESTKKPQPSTLKSNAAVVRKA